MEDDFERRFRAYKALRDARPGDFVNRPGGIDVALDPARAALIERHMAEQYEARSMPAEWAQIGIAYQDPYLRLLRDPVVFATGRLGVHHRVLSNNEPSGAAALPLLGRRAVLIRHFRHATRQWHWEIPRGAIDPGKSAEAAARIELEEEMQGRVDELVALGRAHGASALISGSVALFLARISGYGAAALDEGIAEIREFYVGDIERMIAASEITDSFTLAAFLHGRLRGLL